MTSSVPMKIIQALNNNPNVTYLDSLKLDVLKTVLLEADQRYYSEDDKKQSYLSDDAYDVIKDYVNSKDPKFVKEQVGNKEIKIAGDKVKLPVWMGSMNKKKVLTESIDHVVISDKLDGVSCLIHLKPKMLPVLYTRGNGEIGRNISHLVKHFNNIDVSYEKELMIRGELIIKKDVFTKYRCEESNARNTVAGFVNSKIPDERFKKHIDFVVYEVIKPFGLKLSEQYDLLDKTSFKVVDNEYFEKMNQVLVSEKLNNRRKESEYEIDGIIVTEDKPYKNVTSGNPKHAFAYKENSLEKRMSTVVTNVQWNISKDGYFKPLVHFDMVKIDNVKIEKATGHNARFIVDNSIGKGSTILIERSGDVIPKIVGVVEKAIVVDMPDKPYKWNKTETDILMIENDVNMEDDLKLKQFEFMLKSLKIDNMGPGNISKLYTNKKRTLSDVYNLSVEEISKIEGFQSKSAKNLYDGIQKRRKELTCLDYMVASNTFGRGLGSKNLKKIIELYNPTTSNPSVEDIVAIDGIGSVYGNQYIETLPKFKKFLKENDLDCKDKKELRTTKPVVNGDKMKDMAVVFTGFRDKQLEECVINNGGKVSTSISKKVTYLVCKEIDDNNSKQKKAKDLGVKVMTREDFEKLC
jgi:DNA ligase (NAD+)